MGGWGVEQSACGQGALDQVEGELCGRSPNGTHRSPLAPVILPANLPRARLDCNRRALDCNRRASIDHLMPAPPYGLTLEGPPGRNGFRPSTIPSDAGLETPICDDRS